MIRASLKSLLGRKVRLLMSTFAIVLGVAFVAGSLIFSDTLNRSFTAIFASSVGDVVVQPEGIDESRGATTRTVPEAVLERLGRVDGAARVDGNVRAIGVYVIGKDDKAVGGFGPPAFGGNWNDAPAANGLEGLVLTAGRAPQGPDEVVLDEATAERADYFLGERIRITTATDQELLTPRLVGLVGYEEGGSLNGATLALWDTATAQDLFLEDGGYSNLWVTAEDGVSQEELRDRVAAALPDGLEAVTGDTAADEAASDLLEAISFLERFLLIFAGISLVVGAFLIVNTFSILVAQRSRELALLRALGASKRQVTRSVLLEAFVVGVLGSTLGLGLGVLLAMGIRALFANFGLDLSGQALVFQPTTVVAAYLIGVVVTLAAAYLPARRTARIAPVQALRDDVAMPEVSVRRRLVVGVLLAAAGGTSLALGLFADVPRAGWCVGAGVLGILLGVSAAAPVICRPFLAVARWLFAAVFRSIGNLAGQNSLRNPRRTTATASALMIGLALAGTMSIVGDSAKASVDKTIAESFVGDYVVSNIFGQPFSASIAGRMAEVEGVDRVVRERFAIGGLDGEDQGLAGLEPGTLDDLELVAAEGSFDDLADDTVLVSEEFAAEEGVAVGDTMTWTLPSGEQDFEVVGLYEENPVVFFPVVTTTGALEAAGFPPGDNALIIIAEDDPPVGLQNRLDEVVADNPVVTVKDEAAFAEEQRGPIDQLVTMIYALLGLALVIAVLGIVNTLALSVIERTREIGLLRAIGVTRPQLRRMITLESVVIALLGAVLGVALGIFFGISLMYALRDEGLEVISVPWDQIAVFLGLSVLVGVLAAVFPARRAARLDVLKAIATE